MFIFLLSPGRTKNLKSSDDDDGLTERNLKNRFNQMDGHELQTYLNVKYNIFLKTKIITKLKFKLN